MRFILGRFKAEKTEPHLQPGKKGCLIINLGSPSTPTKKDIRKFLSYFLSDKRVINLPRAVWYPILYGFVLTLRPGRIQETYQSIWLPEGSPLIVYTENQAQELAKALPGVMVRHAYTYSEPTVAHRLTEMIKAGISDLTIIALYPQYAPSTVGATIDQVTKFFQRHSQIPDLKIVSNWHLSQTYIDWYVERTAHALQENQIDALVMSYHSVPEQPAHSPVEYKRHCSETTDAIVAGLRKQGFTPPRVFQTYQSKFGPSKWIGPATIDTMAELPKQGIKRIAVATPGFISDCIETIDEIAVLNAEEFRRAGGEFFHVIAPPNGEPTTGKMLAEVYLSRNPDYQPK